jgi:hypothetical protein
MPWLKSQLQPSWATDVPVWVSVSLGIILIAASVVWILSAARQWSRFRKQGRVAPQLAIRSAAPWILGAFLAAGLLIDFCKVNPQGTNCAPVVTAAPRSLSYWMLVSRVGDRALSEPRPYTDASQSILFPAGSRLSLFVEAAQEGHLYVINEAAQQVNGLPGYALVFPRPDINAGQSKVPGGVPFEVASFEFDSQQGKEKLFLLLSETPVDLLESLHPDEQLRLANLNELQAVQAYLTEQSRQPARVEVLGDKVQASQASGILVRELEFSTL